VIPRLDIGYVLLIDKLIPLEIERVLQEFKISYESYIQLCDAVMNPMKIRPE